MKFNVPQYIDIEDKIAFMLTAKQLAFFAVGGVLLFIIWNFVTQGVFIFWAIIIGLICCVFAFYKPYGTSLIIFLKNAFFHLIKPKIYVWRVDFSMSNTASLGNNVKKKEKKLIKKKVKPENMKQIIELLDS